MSSLMKSMGSMSSLFGMGRSAAGLPPLPSGLGLPERSTTRYIGTMKGERMDGESFYKERAKADVYNKAFAKLLNDQPQLSGGERREIYSAYSDKHLQTGRLASGRDLVPLTDYGKTLSNAGAMTKEQIAAMQQKQQPQPKPSVLPKHEVGTPAKPKPLVAAPKPVVAPQTVGPVPKPTAPAPVATPSVPTAAGNVAGQTQTTGGSEAGGGRRSGRRGRFATLLSGLGGAVESFGL